MTEPPNLCADHAPVIRNLAAKDHIGDRDSERVALSIAKQCPSCVAKEGTPS